MVLTLSLRIKSYGANLQTKDLHAYFTAVLLIMLDKIVLTFESFDEVVERDQLNERYRAVLFCGTVYYAVQGGSHF